MGHQIIKADKRVNLYLGWSSVVDEPVFVGSREEMLNHLMDDYRPGSARYESELMQAEQRLDRTDEFGSSAPSPFGCTWDEYGQMFRQSGTLLRKDFLAAALLWQYCNEDYAEAVILKLLEPFEDEDCDDTD